ncbi:SigE family RNA polymerase sigma factor [Cryptosporangium sp. NPDC048952]|uniref:SigE family RNA polymerase sigma factor n=1 Tax=Cryptosporangium sp. NPDC048952 TaxID=3363961 RepID=UPI00371ED542
MRRHRETHYEGLDALIATRSHALLATAGLLAGGREAGQDLLQAAIEKLMRQWHRIEGDREAYLRRILYHLAVDNWRRRRRRPEVLTDLDPTAAQPDGTGALTLRLALVQALGTLTPRQRAVLVLRYFEELSEVEIAEALGCSTGTVKSTAARGMKHLREITATWPVEDRPLEGATEPKGAHR